MSKQSPWGEILEKQEIKPGITYISTALHGGLSLSGLFFDRLSEYSKNAAIKFNNLYFYEETYSLHLVNLELNLSLSDLTSSLKQIQQRYPDYFDLPSNNHFLSELKKEQNKIEQDKEKAIRLRDSDFIISAIKLDDGWKLLSADDREFLSLNYLENKKISEHEILGEITNFYEKDQKHFLSSELPESLISKFDLTLNTELRAQISNTKNSYILELYKIEDLSYLGDVNICDHPQLIKVWIDE